MTGRAKSANRLRRGLEEKGKRKIEAGLLEADGGYHGGGKNMTVKGQSDQEKMEINCHRCNGRMAFEKFYGPENIFFGWHCVICGEILDPVILLHRLSQDAGIAIPDKEEDILSLIKQFMWSKPKSGVKINPS